SGQWNDAYRMGGTHVRSAGEELQRRCDDSHDYLGSRRYVVLQWSVEYTGIGFARECGRGDLFGRLRVCSTAGGGTGVVDVQLRYLAGHGRRSDHVECL